MKIVPIHPYHPKIVAQIAAERPDVRAVEAVPGGPGPVVAIRKMPPFACDAILVTDPAFLLAAVSVACDAPGVRLVPMGEVLAEMMGAPAGSVVEVERGPGQSSKVRFS